MLDPVPAPFHDGHGAVEVGLEVEVVDLALAAEAVGVHVHEVGAAREARVDPLDHEGGRGDGAAHAEAGAESLGEGGLAGAERSVQDQQVARAQRPGERLGEGAGAVRVAGAQHEGAVGLPRRAARSARSARPVNAERVRAGPVQRAHARTSRVTRPETEVSTS